MNGATKVFERLHFQTPLLDGIYKLLFEFQLFPIKLLYHYELGGRISGISGCIIDMTASSQTFLGLLGPAMIIGPLI